MEPKHRLWGDHVEDQHADNSSPELGRYVRALRRRWLVILVTTLLVTGLALAYALAATKTVTATATVNINVITPSAFVAQRPASGLIDPETEEQLARSSAVLQEVAAALGDGTTIEDVRRNMTVDVLPEATVVQFNYSSPDASTAVEGADLLGAAYLESRSATAQAKVDRILSQLADRRSELRAELVDLNRVLGQASDGSRRAAEASAQRQIVRAQIDSVTTEINTLITVDTRGGDVVTAAADNAVSVQPHRQRLVEIGLVLGLILGVVAALVVNALDRRVRDRDSVAQAGGGRVVAALSRRRATVPPHPADHDELRRARERALTALPASAAVLSVIDLTTGAGPGDVAPNLALVFAESGRTVDLLLPSWTDEHIARLRDELGAPARWFRDDTLGGDVAALTIAQPSEAGAVHQPPEAATQRWQGSDHADKAQLTLIGLLPMKEATSVALSAVRRSDAVLLVVEEGRTSKATVSSMSEELQATGTPVLGTVLVRSRRSLDLGAPKTGSQR